ncbi:hypothetical protein CK485_12705 [Streptomyces sp. ICBB 8177]|nr:hypothetical protein CK485_12705 [Streptomyces sp. ICBB 8177]
MRCDAGTAHGSGGRGVFAVVQPCDADRGPTSPAIGLGPVPDRAGASVVCRWLKAGCPDDGSLPAELRPGPPPRTVAHLN